MGYTVYAFRPDTKQAWKLNVSKHWINKHDNGHLISIGVEVGKDITDKQLQLCYRTEVPWSEWNHSGCQSRCIKRGDEKCQW